MKNKMKWENPYYDGEINSNPLVMHGAPIVSGTSVTVVSVLAAVKSGDSRAEVATRFRITKAQVKACIGYARENWPQYFVAFVIGRTETFLELTGS